MLMFVDDTSVFTNTPEQMQPALDLINSQFDKFGLSINVPKSAALHYAGLDSLGCAACGRVAGARSSFIICDACHRAFHMGCLVPRLDAVPEGSWLCAGCGSEGTSDRDSVLHPPLKLNDLPLEWEQESFKYLGVLTSSDCTMDAELSRRISAAAGAFAQLKPVLSQRGRNQIGLGPASQLLNALVGAVLLYGCEAWALSERQLKRLEVFQRRCTRVALVGRNNDLEDEEKYGKIRVPRVATLLARIQLRWIGHLARCDEERLLRTVQSAVRKGARPLAGHCPPSLTGANGRYRHLLNTHLTAEARRVHFARSRGKWYELAQDRASWKAFADTAAV